MGYDANALYLWAISEVMPVGDYGTIEQYDLGQLKTDVMSYKFGYVECDIRVPEKLKEHFIAETMKLIGNALYGRTVMDKEKHTTTTFCSREKANKRINDLTLKTLKS